MQIIKITAGLNTLLASFCMLHLNTLAQFLGRCRSGLLKLRTAVHNPDREDVSGGPWQSPNLVQNLI